MYKVIAIDPRPASKEAMIELLKSNAPVWGIEFTLPSLEQYIEFNLDGQHVEGGNGKTAIELAAEIPLPLTGDTTFSVVRPDADALGAIAVLMIRTKKWREGQNLSDEMRERIDLISKYDKFAMGPWSPQPLTSRELSEDQKIFKSISACCLDHKLSIEDRIARVQKWIVEGDFGGFESYQGKVLSEMDKANAESAIRKEDGIAIIKSRNIGATSLGYAIAPIVVVRNDAFQFQGGEPHVKYTICQWQEGYVDLPAIIKELNEIEKSNGTWGGSKTICGSPQGVSSSVILEQVVDIVKRHKR